MKATAIAPSNIAFTKYWGRKDEILRLPENGSISMCLSNLLTTTTVEFSSTYEQDEITINGRGLEQDENNKAIKHLDRIRKLAGMTPFSNVIARSVATKQSRSVNNPTKIASLIARNDDIQKINYKAKVVSNNNFPSGTGLSSSASGFAALTVAASKAAGLDLSEKELSILARQGSGSACRSIPSGFVEWLDGDTSDTSYAVQIFPPGWWDITDIVAVVSEGKKEIPTSLGQQSAQSSPFTSARLRRMKKKNEKIKKLIKERNFAEFGKLSEQEALELHAIMLTQIPPLIYWTPGTLRIMKLVSRWRTEEVPVYFTINTGQDIHLICQQQNAARVQTQLRKLPEVKNIIANTPGQGARLTREHLF